MLTFRQDKIFSVFSQLFFLISSIRNDPVCTYLLHLEGTILHTTFLPIGLRTKQVREQPIPNYSGGTEFLRERLSIAQQASCLLHLEGTILHTTFLPGLRTKQAREQPTPNYSGGSEFLRERLSIAYKLRAFYLAFQQRKPKQAPARTHRRAAANCERLSIAHKLGRFVHVL